MDNRFKNIINFTTMYAGTNEGKMVYSNIFNVLTNNRKLHNYTENNNGIHFVLNDIPEDILIVLEQFISNFNKVIEEGKNYENSRKSILNEYSAHYIKNSKENISDSHITIQESSFTDYLDNTNESEYENYSAYNDSEMDLFGDDYD